MNASLLVTRIILIAVFFVAAWFLRPIVGQPVPSVIIAALLGAGVIALEIRLRAASAKSIVGGTIGVSIGLVTAAILGFLISMQDMSAIHPDLKSFLAIALTLSFGYIGLLVGAAKGDLREFFSLSSAPTQNRTQHLVLDTSVIIDGRVADIAETGFLAGRLVIPQFVLRELQQVADSADSTKRNRGRRGLDILQRIQKNQNLDISITDVDFQEVREVDLKLIELAKQLDGKIVTNDFNLNKVAQLRGVPVLNINELANALRPVVLPGETMRVFILKEGKEYNQGVAYLDDGTMVVVDNARRNIGKTIDISVTSVLQTTAGKMIFGKFAEDLGNSKSPDAPVREPRAERPDRLDRMDRSERPERLNAPRPITPTTSDRAR